MTATTPLPAHDWSLNLTEAARQYIQDYLSRHPGGLRLGLDSKGCSGYRLAADIVAQPEVGDACLTMEGITVFVQADALDKLNGATVDYVTQGLNRQLVFRVPQAVDYCGCGESFRFKEQSSATHSSDDSA